MYVNFIISYNRGFTPNKTRYRRMMLVGYLSPTIIIIMTMITEKADALIKPKLLVAIIKILLKMLSAIN